MEQIMNIQITGHGVKVTPALKSFAEEKFSKLLSHYANAQSCHITFDIEKLSQTAQATILYNKIEIHAKSEEADLYTAIDSLQRKLERQLEKAKEINMHH